LEAVEEVAEAEPFDGALFIKETVLDDDYSEEGLESGGWMAANIALGITAVGLAWAWLDDAAKGASKLDDVCRRSGIAILDREGDVIMGAFKVAGGKAEFVAEIVREGDTIILRGAHIEGDAKLAEVIALAKRFGCEQGASKVIIEGGMRTTGARPGHIPKPIVIEVN
jgi:hypothetical protein